MKHVSEHDVRWKTSNGLINIIEELVPKSAATYFSTILNQDKKAFESTKNSFGTVAHDTRRAFVKLYTTLEKKLADQKNHDVTNMQSALIKAGATYNHPSEFTPGTPPNTELQDVELSPYKGPLIHTLETNFN